MYVRSSWFQLSCSSSYCTSVNQISCCGVHCDGSSLVLNASTWNTVLERMSDLFLVPAKKKTHVFLNWNILHHCKSSTLSFVYLFINGNLNQDSIAVYFLQSIWAFPWFLVVWTLLILWFNAFLNVVMAKLSLMNRLLHFLTKLDGALGLLWDKLWALLWTESTI